MHHQPLLNPPPFTLKLSLNVTRHPQDRTSEQRKKRQRLLSAAQSARIRRGMIRYMELVRLRWAWPPRL